MFNTLDVPKQTGCLIPYNRYVERSAKVAELADAPDLGSGGEIHEGSSPSFRTNNFIQSVPFPLDQRMHWRI